jgi:hypothetical protein
MKRSIFTVFFIILLFSSCENQDNQNKEIEKLLSAYKNDKFDLICSQQDTENFKIYILNKFNGNVFVRLKNGACYLAKNNLPKSEYNLPTYTFKILDGKDDNDQIVLLDKFTGEVQIMSFTNAWYVATNEVIQ